MVFEVTSVIATLLLENDYDKSSLHISDFIRENSSSTTRKMSSMKQ